MALGSAGTLTALGGPHRTGIALQLAFGCYFEAAGFEAAGGEAACAASHASSKKAGLLAAPASLPAADGGSFAAERPPKRCMSSAMSLSMSS